MSKTGKIAAVLAVSAAGIVFGSSGAPALAGAEQFLGLNANGPCEPKEEVTRSGNVTVQTITKKCSQTTRQSTSATGRGAGNQEVVRSEPFTVDAGDRATTLRQSCPRGKMVIGGGYDLSNSILNGTSSAELIRSSRPNSAGTGWEIVAVNPTENDFEVSVKAVCADPA